MIRPILADVDDTLIDTRDIQRWAWTEWATRHGLDPAPFINHDGPRITEKLALYAPHLPPTEAADIIAITKTCPLAPNPLPGARRLIETTPFLALVTSGARPITLPLLTRAGLELPPVTVFADDVTHGKPHSEPYLTAAWRLAADPHDCIVLENAPDGVISGVTAGAVVVGITTTTTADALLKAGATLALPSVAAFLDLRDAGNLPPPRPGACSV